MTINKINGLIYELGDGIGKGRVSAKLYPPRDVAGRPVYDSVLLRVGGPVRSTILIRAEDLILKD